VPRHVTSRAVRSYRTFSPLPARSARLGGLFSVALSMGSRPPGVTWRPARWSPDFPPQSPRKATRRLSGRLLLPRTEYFTTTGFARGKPLLKSRDGRSWYATGMSHERVCPSEGDMPVAYHEQAQEAPPCCPSGPVKSIGRPFFTGRVAHFPGGDHRKDLEEKEKHKKEPREKAGDQYQFVR